MNMGAQIGGAVTAQLTPWIALKFGWTASFLVAAGLCVIGAATWLIVDPQRKLAPTEENAAALNSGPSDWPTASKQAGVDPHPS